jgi:L-malate glycosyltransferase
MKILYFTYGQSPHDLRFLNSLSHTGNQVAVLCMDRSHADWPEGIRVLSWPDTKREFNWPNSLWCARALKQIVNEFQPDVIHAGPIQRVAFIAALAKVSPLLSMSWGSDLLLEADKNALWRWITRFTLKRTAWLAADCQTVVKKVRSFGYTGPVTVFPWGVDLEHFTTGQVGSLRKQLGWEKNLVFLSNRSMEPVYGVDIVAEAFAQASQKNDALRLFLFGKGSLEISIRAVLKKAQDAGKVYYGGFVSLQELPDIYRSADVYVSASHSDGSSVSLMEALACGKPALLSDISSNQEWIEPEKQGWFFPDGNILALTERMLNLSSETDLTEISRNARKLAEARADWSKNFAILLGVYSQLAELQTRNL